jgi:hypothetical protein
MALNDLFTHICKNASYISTHLRILTNSLLKVNTIIYSIKNLHIQYLWNCIILVRITSSFRHKLSRRLFGFFSRSIPDNWHWKMCSISPWSCLNEWKKISIRFISSTVMIWEINQGLIICQLQSNERMIFVTSMDFLCSKKKQEIIS